VGLALGATGSLDVFAIVETPTTFLRERTTGIIDTLTDEVRPHMRPTALHSRSTTNYFASLERMRRSKNALYLSAAMAVHPQLRFSGYFHRTAMVSYTNGSDKAVFGPGAMIPRLST
jgi:hypothetical protein